MVIINQEDVFAFVQRNTTARDVAELPVAKMRRICEFLDVHSTTSLNRRDLVRIVISRLCDDSASVVSVRERCKVRAVCQRR